MEGRDRRLFRAIVEGDLPTVKTIVPRRMISRAVLFFPVVEKLKRWEIGRYLLDTLPELPTHSSQIEDTFKLAIQCCHPRFVREWIEYIREDESWYDDHPWVPVWLSQLQLTMGIIIEGQYPSLEERNWWWQTTIGLFSDYTEDLFEEDWSDKVFPFNLERRINGIYRSQGGLFRMLLLADVIPWQDDFHKYPESLHPLTLDLVLSKSKLSRKQLLEMLRSCLRSDSPKPSVDRARVILKYLSRDEIPMSVLLTAIDLGPEMTALFL